MNSALCIRLIPLAVIALFVLIFGDDADRLAFGGALTFSLAMAGGVASS